MSEAGDANGDGWVVCGLGHRHWGRFGAAGILVVHGGSVLLQHRSGWTHEGGTWAVPGGARDRHEDALTAALREATEETTLDPSGLRPVAEWVDDHGGWSYTTVVVRAPAAGETRPANAESDAVCWWPIAEVTALPLHRGFAAAWPQLQGLLQQG